MIIAVALGTTACSDFLEITPSDQITGGSLTADNLAALTGPLYNRVWFDFNGNFYYGLGDGAAYNLYAPYSNYIYPFSDFTVSGLTGPLVSAWQSFYIVIQQANKVIVTINESSANQETKNRYIAEARFMRGAAYWYLASLWGNVVLCEDPSYLVSNTLVNTNPRKDVFEFTIRDLEFAAKYLPATAVSGRVNKYSAYGMLSRVYLAFSGLVDNESNPNAGTRNQAYLDLARQAAQVVIEKSSFKLLPSYPDLFTIAGNNNSESMFALQWLPNLTSDTGYGLINTQQAYFAYSAAITGDDAAWGGATMCPYNMIKEYESNDIIRRKATWMGEGDFYEELDKGNGGLLFTRNNGNQQISVKKGVSGSNKDSGGKSGRMNSALNTYMLRLAEVYLNYAEAILGNSATTSDPEALAYFNAVRTRTGELSAKTSISYDDIRHERRVEFCMEGQYWYDLVNRSYYKQQEVINYLIGQDRGTITPFLFDAPNNLRVDPDRDPGTRAIGTIDASVFLLPYPSDEVIKDPLLKEAPVPYNFTEEKITDLFN
jgi:hypothetical protein